MNGYWFAWNGWWNGKAEGPEKFEEAYRHIVKQVSKRGADNITWVFHVNGSDDPNPADECEAQLGVNWNRFERYYPDDVIDWLGGSVYGAQRPADDECPPFKHRMDEAYRRLKAMTGARFKPIFVLEFGATMNNKHCGKQPNDPQCKKLGGAALWADQALDSILNNPQWRERLRGFSWWDEWWDNDEEKEHDTNMRVQDVPCLKEVFRKHLVTGDPQKQKILERPLP